MIYQNLKSPHPFDTEKEDLKQSPLQKQYATKLFSESYRTPKTSINKQERKYIYIRRFFNALKKKQEDRDNISEDYVSYVGDQGANTKINGSNRQLRILSTHLRMELRVKFQEKMRQLFNSSLGQIIFILKRVELFKPESSVKVIWDFASLISRLYFLFLIPLDIAFSKFSFMFQIYNIQSLVFLLILLGDLIVGLNTSFYTEGILVTDRKKIAKHNFFKCYGLEWISTIQLLIYQILTQDDDIHEKIKDYTIYLTLLTFLVHYSTINECLTYYEEGLSLNKKFSSILELIKLIGTLFFLVHIFSCFWLYVGMYSHQNYDVSWLDKIAHENWTVIYLHSMYYASVTIFTVGYGDITPQSNLEKIVSCFLILFASLQLPYSINTVGAIVQEIKEYGEDKKKKIRIINSFMQKKQIPFLLQSEIRQYLHYFWQLDKKQDAEEAKTIVNQLSENLKNQLIQESNAIILNQCSLFRYRFTSAFKAELVKALKSKILPPETLIPQKNQLVYIESGQIDQFGDEKCDLKLHTFQKGSTIGLISFLLENDKKEFFRSQGFASILTLSQKKFFKLLSKYPADYEIYCQTKDYIIFNGNETSMIPRKCYICQSNSHYSKDCPTVHFQPDREKIIKQAAISIQQQRIFTRRKEKRTINYKESQLNKGAFIVQQQNPNIIKLYDIPEKIDEPIKINSLDCYKNIKNGMNQKKLQLQFQKLVRKVVLINKSYPQFLINICESFRATSNYFSSTSQLRYLRIRYDYLKQLIGVDITLLESLDYQIRKNEQSPFIRPLEFDIPKNFVYYNPKFNFNNVKIVQDKQKQRIIYQFLQYVLYPAQIIRQVHATKCSIDLITYKRRNNVIKN